MRKLAVIVLVLGLLSGCGEDTSEAQLIFKFKMDPTQIRLNNIGEPATVPVGHAAQSPDFNTISAHYIELAPSALTPLGAGEILYKNAETNAGGANAIDFSKAIIVAEDEIFISIPISAIEAGDYKWLRVSLAYQNFNIVLDAEISGTNFENVSATAASFVGFNTYIKKHTVKNETITVNGNKSQGYVGVETLWTLDEFQSPPNATTVPNPIFNTSPIPAGSCVVTGEFETPLTITGEETEDITIIMSLSTNNSFEWEDNNGNGKYEPLLGELVVDMGLRGLIPIIE
jgi:hypothetical protein